MGELARHWFNATQPIDVAKAIAYSRQAADAALAALAPDEALRYYAQAIELSTQTEPDPVLAIDLGIGLGTAQRQTGDSAFRETLLEAAGVAESIGDTDRLASAALANNRGFYSAAGATDDDKVSILEIALARLPADHRDRPLVLATLCSELIWGSSLERRQALADEALAVAEASGDDSTVVRVLNQTSYPLYGPPLLELSLARTAVALTRAERLGDPVMLFLAAMWRAETVALAADLDAMDRSIETMGSLLENLAEPTLKWSHAMMRTLRALIAGDTDQAEQLAAETLQHGTDGGQPDAAFFYGMHLIQVNMQRGTLGELLPLMNEMSAELTDVDPAMINGVLALANVEGNHLDEARHLLSGFAAAGFELSLNPAWINAMVAYAEVAVACNDTQCAKPLFDRLAPWADQLSTNGGTAVDGPVSHYLGGLASVLGRYDEADAYFTQASAFNERVDAKFFAARTNLWWGHMLVERDAPGDVEKGRKLLAKAHTAATANGYASVERRAARALQEFD